MTVNNNNNNTDTNINKRYLSDSGVDSPAISLRSQIGGPLKEVIRHFCPVDKIAK